MTCRIGVLRQEPGSCFCSRLVARTASAQVRGAAPAGPWTPTRIWRLEHRDAHAPSRLAQRNTGPVLTLWIRGSQAGAAIPAAAAIKCEFIKTFKVRFTLNKVLRTRRLSRAMP